MFEGWVSDLLAAYLGQFLDVQREQLRISLFKAWKTGVSLTDVSIRPEAFEHLELPLKLYGGRVGGISLQIPWSPRQKSPIAVQLDDMHLSFCLLSEEDLDPENALRRAWMAKQAALAALEMQSMASRNQVGAASSAETGNDDRGDSNRMIQGGMFWSFWHRLGIFVLKKLEIKIRRIHVKVHDPWTGRSVGFCIDSLNLTTPAGDAGRERNGSDILPQVQNAAMNTLQKELQIDVCQMYWVPPRASSDASYDEERGADINAVPLHQRLSWTMLHIESFSTNLCLQYSISSSLSFFSAHISIEIPNAVPLSVKTSQIEDWRQFGDHLEWLAVRARYAHLRPHPAVLPPSNSAVEAHERITKTREWKSVWKYAINAVVRDLKGRFAVPWQMSEKLSSSRQRYALLYRKKLFLEQGTESDASLQSNTMRSRRTHATRGTNDAGLEEGAEHHGHESIGALHRERNLTRIGQKQLLELEQKLSLNDIISCRMAVRQSFEYPASSTVKEPGQASFLLRGISRGIARTAGFLGYVPEAGEEMLSIREPTLAEIEELLRVVQMPIDQITDRRDVSAEHPGPDGRAETFNNATSRGAITENAFGTNRVQHSQTQCICMIPSIDIELVEEIGCGAPALLSSCLMGLQVEISRSSSDDLSCSAKLDNAKIEDHVSEIQIGTPCSILSRKRDSVRPNESEQTRTEDEDDTVWEVAPPLLQLSYSGDRSREGRFGGIATASMDVLLQPIRVQLTDRTLNAAMAIFQADASSDSSFAARKREATRGLSPEAQTRMTAQSMRREGLPVDLVCKVVDAEAILWRTQRRGQQERQESDDASCVIDGLGICTGEVVANSRIDRELYGAFLADASSQGLRSKKVMGSESPSSRDVQSSVLYSNDAKLLFSDFVVNVTHARAFLLVDPRENRREIEDTRSLCIGGRRKIATVLEPLALSAVVRLCRFPTVQEYPNLKCNVKAESLRVFLPQNVVSFLAWVGATIDASPSEPMHHVGESRRFAKEVVHPDDRHPHENDLPTVKRESKYLSAVVEIDLEDVVVSYGDIDGDAESSKSENLQQPRLVVLSSKIGIQFHERRGFAADITCNSLRFEHFAPHYFVAGGCATRSTAPMAELLLVDRLNVLHQDALEHWPCEDLSTTKIHFIGLTMKGDEDNAGKLLRRLRDRERSTVSLDILTMPSSREQHVAVRLKNLLIGHRLVLGLVQLFTESFEVERNAEKGSAGVLFGNDDGASPLSSERCGGGGMADTHLALAEVHEAPLDELNMSYSIHVEDSRIVWHYNEKYSREDGLLPAHLQDFLLVQRDIVVVDVPLLAVNAPFLDATERHNLLLQYYQTQHQDGIVERDASCVLAQGISLYLATSGFPGHPLLPVLQTSKIAMGPGASAERMTLRVDAIDIGVHPYHLELLSCMHWLVEAEWRDTNAGPPLAEPHESMADRALAPMHLDASRARSCEAHASLESKNGSQETVKRSTISDGNRRRSSPWALEMAVQQIGVSVLGSTASSTSIKLEWTEASVLLEKKEKDDGACGQDDGKKSSSGRLLLASIDWNDITVYGLRPKPALELGPSLDVAGGSNPPPQQLEREGADDDREFYDNDNDQISNVQENRGTSHQESRAIVPPVHLSSLPGITAASFAPTEEEGRGQGEYSWREASYLFHDAESSTTTYMLPRASGGSAVSRYFSAIESEYNDVVSEVFSPDDVKSPALDSILRKGSPMPLNIQDGDQHVHVLLRISVCKSSQASRGITVTLSHAKSSCMPSVDVALTSIYVRGYLHGWQAAAECVTTYAAFVSRLGLMDLYANQRSAEQQPSVPLELIKEDQKFHSNQNAVHVPRQEQDGTVASDGCDVAVRVESLVLEAIAASETVQEERGIDALNARYVPVTQGVFHFRLYRPADNISSDVEGLYVHRGCALVGVGLARHPAKGSDPMLQMKESEAFIGLNGLNVSSNTEDVMGDRSCRRETSKTNSLQMSVQQISLWLSSEKLCLVAALWQHMQHFTSDLSVLYHAFPSVKQHHSSNAVGDGKRMNLSSLSLHRVELNCHRAAVLLHGKGSPLVAFPSPVLEMAICDLSGGVEDSDWSGAAVGRASMRLQADVFNVAKLAWEPLIDPWDLHVSICIPNNATCGGGLPNNHKRPMRGGRSQSVTLDFESDSGLEISVSQSAIAMTKFAMDTLADVQLVLQEPDAIGQESRMVSFSSHEGLFSSSHSVNNMTDLCMEVWLEAPGTTVVSLDANAPLAIVPPWTAINLDAVTAMSDACNVTVGYFVGSPSVEVGVTSNGGLTRVPVGSNKFYKGCNASHRRNQLYFRFLCDQNTSIAGPINVEATELRRHSLGIPSAAKGHARSLDERKSSSGGSSYCSSQTGLHVFSRTEVKSDGTCTITFRSCIRIRNDSDVDLEVSVEAPCVPHSGHSDDTRSMLLPRRGDTWLSVSHGDDSLLSFHPVAMHQSYDAGEDPRGLEHSVSAPMEYNWSPKVALQDLFDAELYVMAARQVECRSLGTGGPCLTFYLGSICSGNDNCMRTIVVAAPVVFHNSLPVPVEVELRQANSTLLSSHVKPNQRIPLTDIGATQIVSLGLHVVGFEPSPHVHPVPISNAAIARRRARILQSDTQPDSVEMRTSSLDDNISKILGEDGTLWASAAATTTLMERRPGHLKVDVAVQHGVQVMTGSHCFRIVCGLWVFNWIGMPISIREGAIEPSPHETDILPPSVEDVVPDTWVPPLTLEDITATTVQENPTMSQRSGASSNMIASPSSAAETPRNHIDHVGSSVTTPSPLPLSRSHSFMSSRRDHDVHRNSARRNRMNLGALATARSSAAGSILSFGRAASNVDVAGLADVLDVIQSGSGGRPGSMRGSAQGLRSLRQNISSSNRARYSVLSKHSVISQPARGIAESMEKVPTFEMPSSSPSMISPPGTVRRGMLGTCTVGNGSTTKPGVSGTRLRLQLRATQVKAPSGRTFWSETMELNDSGGIKILDVPVPAATTGLPPRTRSRESRSSLYPDQKSGVFPHSMGIYPVVVSAVPIPDAGGALKLSISPRYVLHNLLGVPVQVRQQGAPANTDCELQPGGAIAVRWTDTQLPQQLSVRLQEAGWMWSGGFSLERSADLFVKIRHRDRGITMLMRVDVSSNPREEVLHVTLSHNPEGFAPYRIDNCSLEILHCRQVGVREQQDVLRPYCSLMYAWDEPTRPHVLLLEWPGGKVLGKFHMDKVGQDVRLPTHRGETQKLLRVLVKAEGPTRVLKIVDMKRHGFLNQLDSNDKDDALIDSHAWNSNDIFKSKSPGDLRWSVRFSLKSIGASLVGNNDEIAYARLSSCSFQLAAGISGLATRVQIDTIQVDNPSPFATFPVSLVLPAPVSRLSKSVADAVELIRPPALVGSLSLWKRHRSGVLCVEALKIDIPSLALYIDQDHAMNLFEIVKGMISCLDRLSSDEFSRKIEDNDPSKSAVQETPSLHSDMESSTVSSRTVPSDGLRRNAVGLTPSAIVRSEERSARSRRDDCSEAVKIEDESVLWSLPPSYRKIYIDSLSFSDIMITLSFLPSSNMAFAANGMGDSIQMKTNMGRTSTLHHLLSLADIEDAHLTLSRLEMHHPFLDSQALINSIQRHYARALLPEVFKIIGSASVFGDPATLFHHLGLGVWTFVSAPAAGLLDSARHLGPKRFLAGILLGTQGLLQNFVFAISNAATKASSAARKAMLVWGLDQRADLLPVSWRGNVESSISSFPADRNLVAASFRGLIGLVAEPVGGFEEGGVRGLLRGLRAGVVGAFVIPLASLLEMFAHTADSVRRSVAGSSSVGWLRPPRFVSSTEALPRYDWSEAMGRWLLAEVLRDENTMVWKHARRTLSATAVTTTGTGRSRRSTNAIDTIRGISSLSERFVFSVPVRPSDCYVVITDRRVIFARTKEIMWKPEVLWQSKIADIELVGFCDASTEAGDGDCRDNAEVCSSCRVRFVAHPPAENFLTGGIYRGDRKRGLVPRNIFSFLRVECRSRDEAKDLVDATRLLMMNLTTILKPFLHS